jgi:hypothetical protein
MPFVSAKCFYLELFNLLTVMEAWGLARKIWFNPPFLWKCLYQVRAIVVFSVFRLLTDFVCLLIYEFCLSLWKIARCLVILLLSVLIYSWKQQKYQLNIWMRENVSCTLNVLDYWDRGKSISTYLQLGRIKIMNEFSMLYYAIATIKQLHLFATHFCLVLILPIMLYLNPCRVQKYPILYLSNNRIASPLITIHTHGFKLLYTLVGCIIHFKSTMSSVVLF